MTEFCQLYDEQGRAIEGKGETHQNIYLNALLHGAAHVWIWRKHKGELEILLQKRAVKKWNGRYDISAAGKIALGESPVEAALREVKEEIGFDLDEEKLQLIGLNRRTTVAPDKSWISNEFRWLYTTEVSGDQAFSLAGTDGEVQSLSWRSLTEIQADIQDPERYERYVPHGETYFRTVFEAITS